MRGALKVALVFLAACMLMGMASLGGTPEGTIPKTDENVRAKVIDRSGVSTELAQFSMDGEVFLKGKRGEGDMNVLFRKISEITFGQVSGDNAPVNLVLKAGGNLQLNVHKSAFFYGDTGSGVYRILAGDVSRIIFHK